MDDISTIDEAARRYIRYLARVAGYSPETARSYGSHLRAYAQWARERGEGGLNVDAGTLRSYLAYLGGEGRSARTIAAHASSLRSLFSWLVDEGYLEQNPAAALVSPKLAAALPHTLTPDDIRRLFAVADLSTAEGLRDATMLELFYATGARISEVAALHVGSVDLSSGHVRLIGKGSKERVVPMHRRAVDAVRAYLANGRPVLLSRGHTDQGHVGALFISSRGRAMDAAALRYRFRSLCARAAIPPDITPHDMRHTFATDLLKGGADLRSVQELLGHASLSTTQIYTHLTPERMREAVGMAHPRAE